MPVLSRSTWERVVAFAPQLTGYLRALAFRRGKGGIEFPLAGATLRNGFLEKTFRQGRREKHKYRLRSPRLTENGHIGWIAAEGGNVVANPAQRLLLIEARIVTGANEGKLGGQRLVGEKREDVKAVIKGNNNDGFAVRCKRTRIKIVRRGVYLAPGMDPHHHRQFIVSASGRREDVQVKAVFVDTCVLTFLRARSFGFEGLQDILPRLCRLWGRPAQLPDWRSRKRNTSEHFEAAVG